MPCGSASVSLKKLCGSEGHALYAMLFTSFTPASLAFDLSGSTEAACLELVLSLVSLAALQGANIRERTKATK